MTKFLELSCSKFCIIFKEKPLIMFTRKNRIKLYKKHLKSICKAKKLNPPVLFSYTGSETNREVIQKQSVAHVNFINILWREKLYDLWVGSENHNLRYV